MKRRGNSLVEMLVFIAVSGVVMTMAVTFLATMLRAESSVRRRATTTFAASRLDRQFRDDVHGALRATTPTEDSTQKELLRLHGPDDELIEYLADRGALWRKVSRGQQTIHSDRFVMADGQTARSEVRRFENREFVTLELVASPKARSWTAPFRAIAELNRAARLSIEGTRP